MKIHKNNKIELVASTDATRHILCNPYLDGTTLVATDGRRLVAIPVELGENDCDGYISKQALKDSRKIKKDIVDITANGSLKFTTKDGEVTLQRPEKENYPDWKRAIPNFEGKPVVKACFNAKFLYEMAQALGSTNDSVEITFTDVTSPIMVKANMTATPNAYGVLMPVKVS